MPLRVLQLSWEYPPVVEGGLARHVHKLSEALVAGGAEVHVLTRGGPQLQAATEQGGVLVHRVPEGRAPVTDLDAFFRWTGELDAALGAEGRRLWPQHGPFDVVHGHDWLVAGAAARLADRFGVPYVTTIHATEHGRHQGWVQDHPQSHVHAVEGRMAARADAVLVCSQAMVEHVEDVFAVAPDRLAVVPNGIDPADLAAPRAFDLTAFRASLAHREDALVLLSGRLVYEKGFHVALEALASLVARRGRVRYVVAGSGPQEDDLRALAHRLGLTGYGSFLGWVGDELLPALYRVADVCAVPSLYEPFGLVALEAMAVGCPVVAADTGGLREVVSDGTGLRVPAGKPAPLAAAITRVLDEPGLAPALSAAATAHLDAFTWPAAATAVAARYAALGAGAPRVVAATP